MNEIGQLNKAQLAQLKEVDRAIEASASKQPRFTDTKDTFYSAIINWVKYAVNEWAEPDYQADSRKRDAWLREVWRREPHWSGIINQTVLVDSGRGWSLTGGRNQVRRYTEILHQADGGQGWRHFFRRTSLSYVLLTLARSLKLVGTG